MRGRRNERFWTRRSTLRVRYAVNGLSFAAPPNRLVAVMLIIPNALTFPRASFGAMFSPFFYRATYLIVFVAGFDFAWARAGEPIAIMLLILLGVTAPVVAAITALVALGRFLHCLVRRNLAHATGHLAAPAMVAIICFLGLQIGDATTLISPLTRLSRALAEFRAGVDPADKNIEILSGDPEVALYQTGYHSGFLTLGVSTFVVIDQTGRLAELAAAKRARDLAATPELKARNYLAYCNIVVKPWLGPYKTATLTDAAGCD